jgi:hypothetical protein
MRSILGLALALFLSCAHAANTPTGDAGWRLQLVRSAADKAGLAEVGLDHRDLYGVIHAESGWVARDGMGKNGVVSQGVAQFEPATARAVGLRDPNDTVQAVEAAAVLLREAAQWSARKLEGMPLAPGEWAVRLREGVSIYYNLSSRARNTWNGRNSDRMPVETQHHIRNARHGASIAGRLEGGGLSVPAWQPPATTPPAPSRATFTAARAPVPARSPSMTVAGIPSMRRTANAIVLPQGRIEWSRPAALAGG